MSRCSVAGVARIASRALVVGLAACGGSAGEAEPTEIDDSTEPAAESTEPASAASSDAPFEATTSGWQNDRVEIVTAGMETQSGEPAIPEVVLVGASSSGFVAAGVYAGALAIWGSDDFLEFTPLYNEVCCERSVYPTAIADFEGTLLVGGNGRDGVSERRFGAVLRSDDAGATWVDAELPAFASQADRVDAVLVVGDSVIVQLVDEDADVGVESKVFRTSDLVEWEEIEFPGSEPAAWPGLVADESSIFAMVYVEDPSGGAGSVAVWSSSDGGRTFEQRPPIPDIAGDRLVVDGALVVLPSRSGLEPRDAEPRGFDVLAAGADWVSTEPDVGQFGDGGSEHAAFASAADGSTYVVLGRELRASAHHCYDDAATCQQLAMVLAAATEPAAWFDVDGLDLPLYWGQPGLVAADDGSIVLWTAVQDEGALDTYRWSSPQPPDLVDPPSYSPPSRPLELFDPSDSLVVGDEFRYVLPTGFCGGMYINDSLWEPETALPDPLPPHWPYRPERPGTSDGPDGYLFGRIEMTATDTIRFSIEGVGVVATYRPSPPAEVQCG